MTAAAESGRDDLTVLARWASQRAVDRRVKARHRRQWAAIAAEVDDYRHGGSRHSADEEALFTHPMLEEQS